MDDIDNSASAGDRPTNRQPPVSSFNDLKGMVLLKAMNQQGCEFLYQKLQERNPEDIQMIFAEVKGHICMLMVHQFGSYVVQKLVHVCDEEQINHMVISVTADLSLLRAVCVDSHGCRSVQELVECLTTRKQLRHLVYAFEKIMFQLVTHPIGVCVIGHCYQFFNLPASEADQIVGAMANDFFDIATCESGSRILRFVMSGDRQLIGHSRVLAGIRVYLFPLTINQFGNHVVQRVIGLGMESMLEFIVSELRGVFALLSQHEYGSNVVKKLIEACKETYAPEIINQIISSHDFSSVLQSPFGYSVVQCAKEYSTGTVRETLNHLISQHSDGQRPGKNALPIKKRKKNHVLLIKNHVLLYKRGKRSNV